MDDNVLSFLDMTLPHTKIIETPDSVTDYKTQVIDQTLRPEASATI